MAKRGLGRGLEALLQSSSPIEEEKNTPTYVSILLLCANAEQPRRLFDENALQELANSIAQYGILQPILVRRLPADDSSVAVEKYEIIAGERRWRAAQLAGLLKVPITIREQVNEGDRMLMALIENMQREDLNVIEQSQALKIMYEKFQLTHEQIAQLTGLSRSNVSNLIRLDDLHDQVKEMVLGSHLTMGQARPLLGLSPEQQVSTALKIVESSWNVRQIESYVNNLLNRSSRKKSNSSALTPHFQKKLEQLSSYFGHKVKFHVSPQGKGGKLTIAFKSPDDCEILFKLLDIANLKK